MKFYKNKKNLILYYIVLFTLLAVIAAIVVVLAFDKNVILRTVSMEFMVLIIALSFSKHIAADVKQTIELGENRFICKGFIIAGNVADGNIEYSLVDKICIKKTILRPFHHHLLISLKGEKPFIITDDFINYKELWSIFCERSKSANPDVCIDKLIQELIS